jgi:hypothetical protein
MDTLAAAVEIFASVASREGPGGIQGGPSIAEAVVDPSYPEPVSRSELDNALGGLIDAGLIEATNAGLSLTSQGRSLWKRMARMKEAGMQRRLAEVVTLRPATGVQSGWTCPDDDWAEAERLVRSDRLRRVRGRLEILKGLIRAIEQWEVLSQVVADAADREAAVEALERSPLSLSEIQAHHVLDMPISRRTVRGRAVLQEEADVLQAQAAQLDR